MDIHRGRGNANKLMNRLLFHAAAFTNLRISSIDGGGLRNAIPRESFSIVTVSAAQEANFLQLISEQEAILKAEYATTDPALLVLLEPAEIPIEVLPADFQYKLLRVLYTCPNGIYRLSPDIENLVQTSNNVARVQVQEGLYTILCLTRSSVDSEKMDLAAAIRSALELMNADVTLAGSYPGWTPRPDAEIVRIMRDLYQDMFDAAPDVNACHAGLECGILGANYPDMEMISFGPNIRGAHSPDEKVQISSVQKYWNFLLETLKQIPVKA